MIQDCKFNPNSDFEETVPELSVDVTEMMASHVVVGSPDSALAYTGETDVKNVGHYLRDKIQTYCAAMKLGSSLSAAAAGAKSTPKEGE